MAWGKTCIFLSGIWLHNLLRLVIRICRYLGTWNRGPEYLNSASLGPSFSGVCLAIIAPEGTKELRGRSLPQRGVILFF